MTHPTRLTPTAPTQVRRPWRATIRTAVATALAIVPFVPEIIDVVGLEGYAWAAGLVGIAATITRLMAIPAVNDALTKVGLGATPNRRTG